MLGDIAGIYYWGLFLGLIAGGYCFPWHLLGFVAEGVGVHCLFWHLLVDFIACPDTCWGFSLLVLTLAGGYRCWHCHHCWGLLLALTHAGGHMRIKRTDERPHTSFSAIGTTHHTTVFPASLLTRKVVKISMYYMWIPRFSTEYQVGNQHQWTVHVDSNRQLHEW